MTLTAKNINFQYDDHQVLFDVSTVFEKGKMYAIEGKSGSGKTTLLSILSGIETKQDGVIYHNGKELRERSLGKFRKEISIVFQSYNLIPYMTAIQNVETALDIMKFRGNKRSEAIKALHAVGIDDEDMNRVC